MMFFRLVCMLVIAASLVSCGGHSSGSSVDTTIRDPLNAIPRVGDGGLASERRVAQLFRGHAKQKRKQFIYNAKLNAVARAKARDMGRRNYFGHVDPDGYGPNYHVTRSGYRLPITWTAFPKTNYIESILAGPATPEQAFASLINSRKHRAHVLATDPFYATHTRYGVGHAVVPGSKYRHYWVFISAPEEGTQR